MQLHYREYGRYREGEPSLLLLHGLLGSSVNWHAIARALEQEHHILVPDLRNHGRSAHSDEISYPAMAEDVIGFLDDQGLDSIIPVGHSMGGKLAMWLALSHPSLIESLVVVDIAPVAYGNRFGTLFDALHELDLDGLSGRREADEVLARRLPDAELRQYLLQNLVFSQRQWSWRMNLHGLTAGLERIIGFPALDDCSPYPGDTYFIYGGNSRYLLPEHEPVIRQWFPYARLRNIAGAGHWVYAEQPQAFLAALRAFLRH